MSSATQPRKIAWQSQSADGQVLLSMPWEIFVLCVAVLSIVNLVLAIVLREPDLEEVIIIIDFILIVIFAIDLLRRLRVADDNRAYLLRGYGWLDFISIFPALRIARLLRIVKVTKILQRMGGPETAVRVFFKDKAAGGLLMVVFIAIMVLEFGSLAVLRVEVNASGANITSAQDAVWYVIVTMSTVGYGDFYPVTGLGHLIGSLIIVVGVGVFGTLTGFLANAFLSPSADSTESPTSTDLDEARPAPVGEAATSR